MWYNNHAWKSNDLKGETDMKYFTVRQSSQVIRSWSQICSQLICRELVQEDME